MPILGSIIKRAIDLGGISQEYRNSKDAGRAQKKELRKILRKAQFTAIGKHYDFAGILQSNDPIKTFQQKVPTYEYNSIFKDWWYRLLTGERYVVWPGQTKYFALSSGTSGASSKQIPVTQDMIRAIRKTSVRQLASLYNYKFSKDFFQKGILMLGGSTHLNFNGTYYEGDLSGINTGKLPFWFQHHYKPGRKISEERDWNTKLEEIVRLAPSWDISAIVGVPAWYQILIEKIIDRYKLKSIHDIWPNLEVFCHGGVAFGPYKTGFEKLLGRPIRYIETYLASEGFIAFQAYPDSEGMQLVCDNGIFFEFVPFNSKNFDEDGNMIGQPECLNITEVEEGKEYALLLTSVAGAYRYLIGDTVRFTSLERKEIVITGRTKHFLNLCGEHMSVDNMNRAIELTEKDLGIEVREFCVSGNKLESMFEHHWFIGTDSHVDEESVAAKIDFHLKELNDDYRVERIEAIKRLRVSILPVDTFYGWMEKHKKLGSQNKFPRVLRNSLLEDWLTYINQKA